ncbi:MAG: MYXO-CTERM sorting domain-containing protein, partial [Myxococcota bacterium]
GAGSLRVRWNRLLGDTALSLGLGPGYLNDLDGDGRFELAISALQDGSERTFFVDAESGVILEELADQAMVGVVELRPGETTVLTTADNTVHAWSFVRGQDIQPLWSLAGQRALAEPDWDAARTLYLSERMLAIDLDGDGVRELFAVDSDSGAELTAFDVSAASPSAAPQARARYRAAERESILAAWTAAIPGDAGRLVVAPSDGVMHVVDSELAPIRYGVRFGGYYPEGGWRNLPMTPVSADLGAGHDSVIVRDSSGALVRVDAPGASLEIKLDPVWHVAKTTSPLIIPNPTGQPPNVACRQTDSDGDHRVSMLDPDGQVLWSTALGGALLSDLVAGNLDGDGTPDVIAQWGLRSDRVLEHRALSGASGEVLWDAEPHTESTTRLPAGGAAVDWDGDGVDDYIHQFYETRVLSGVDGAVLARNDSSSLAYFMPSVADVDSDGRNEVILHGSYFPVRVLDDDFTSVMWQSPEDDRPYPYGSVVTGCSDGVVRLIGGSVANPSRLKITRLGGAEMGQYQAVVLAGGAAFASEEEATATAPRLGQLTSTSVHRNLAGDARPIAVVGSDDGWLYAIDGCTGALEFSVPFGASVGAVAFADSDGDGEDEIIVAVGDGYLYGLRDAPIAAPSWVIDTDPAAGITEDLDITERIRSLSAEWEPVVGADSYEVAVIRAETNEFMSDPPWQNVGEAHAATVTGLSLSHGERYTFVVRAISEDGRSPDAASDGIEVLLPGLPGGCDCQVGQGSTSPKPGPYAGLLVALALVLVGLRRRRR